MDGYYCTYNVEASKVGNYTIRASVVMHNSRSGNNHAQESDLVTYNINVTERPKVVSISIPNSLTLQIDNTYSFSPVIYETGATTTLTWTSSNTSVVSVSGQTIKALAPGQSIITCTASNGVSAQCIVTVPSVFVTDIVLSETSTSINIGEQTTITATITPSNASNKQIEWSSSNQSVAIVSSTGTVTGLSEGYCNVTAAAKDGSGIQSSCLVHVTKPTVLATSISMNSEAANIKVGQTAQLVVTLSPSDVTNAEILWTSSNPECVSVSDRGIINGLTAGTATVTAITTDGTELSASCIVKVLEKNADDFDNTLYANAATGCVGGTVTIPIKMKNVTDVSGFQFNMELPTGFSVVKVERGNRIKTKIGDEYIFNFNSSAQADGTTFILCYTAQNVDINGNDGDVALVTVKIPDGIAKGDYTITMKDIELSKAGSSIITERMTSLLTVSDYVAGDANGDGRISVADLTAIASHLLGNIPAGFVESAADANGDGRVSVADLTAIADILINGTNN